MSDRYEIGRTYYLPAHSVGLCPREDERATLREAVEVVAAKEKPEHYHIELRQVTVGIGGNGATDGPVMKFSGDGRRVLDLDYAVRQLEEVQRRLSHDGVFINALGVENNQPVIQSHLGYAKSALRDLEALANVVRRGIADAEAYAERVGP